MLPFRTRQREEVFILINTSDREDRTFITQFIFMYFIFFITDLLVEDGRTVLHLKLVCPDFAPLKPQKQKEILDFFLDCTFLCFCLFPFGTREEVFISLKRATRKIELKLFSNFLIATIFPPRWQPTTILSAKTITPLET